MTDLSALPATELSVETEFSLPPQDAPLNSPPSTTEGSAVAAVEWDHKGRVILSRFTGGQVCQFRYDTDGNLYGFTYARLAWSTADGTRWTARDNHYVYTIDGLVTACVDGTVRIQRGDVTRTLKLNGTIVDEYTNGTYVESVRPSTELSASDLLAVNQPLQTTESLSAGHPVISPGPMAPAFIERDEAITVPDFDSATSRNSSSAGVKLNRLRLANESDAVRTPPPEDALDSFRAWVSEMAVKAVEAFRGEHDLALVAHLDILADVAYRRRRIDEARVLNERALAIRSMQLGSDHSDTGINHQALGRIYHEWGRFAEAEQCFLESIKVMAKGLGKARFLRDAAAVDDAHLNDYLKLLVSSLHSLASLYHEQKKRHLCEKLYDGAVEACNSVGEQYRVGVESMIESLAAMAAHSELEQKNSRTSGLIKKMKRTR